MKKDSVSMDMPTQYGTFVFTVWRGERGRELVALSSPKLSSNREVLLRIHSECLTGDVFASSTCDCGEQKERALKMIQEHGNGIFIYHRQEGRNMGLFKKVEAYNLMRSGTDTHDANIALVGTPDGRNYADVLTALTELLGGSKSDLCLMSNNPYKKLFLERHGFRVARKPLLVLPNEYNRTYTNTKERKFLHGTSNEVYVSITLNQVDLRRTKAITDLLKQLPQHSSRWVYLGIPLDVRRGDVSNEGLKRALCDFAPAVLQFRQVRVVFHVDYPTSRKEYHDLQSLLHGFSFPYSLQYRFRKESGIQKVDFDLLDALHAERIIFQLKEEHLRVFEHPGYLDYFNHPRCAILLDDSFGSGASEDGEAIKRKVHTLLRYGIGGIGIAGGFSAATVHRLREIEDYFKIPISVDAETKLRTDDKLSIVAAHEYLHAVLNPHSISRTQ